MFVDIFNTENKYDIIYADPPWSYNDKALAGNRGACCKYPVMNTKDMYNFPVKYLAADDCVLFMWATMPKLDEAFELMNAWGFKYKTCAFTWIKKNKKSDSLFWGMGNWTRANTELCLLGIKGKPKRESASVHSVVISPIEEHSKKPDEVRKRIEQLMGGGAKAKLSFSLDRLFLAGTAGETMKT